MTELTDISLLRRYLDEGSEECFDALVARHINKVYAVALRFTHNPAQAEEITQAVFILFARKASKLGKNVSIAGWLYQTARLTATTLVRGEIRRARREQEAHMQNIMKHDESDVWSQIGPLLDAAMSGLNETDRSVVVLRFFDDKSLREIGEELGLTEDTAKKRVQRAVEKLRHYFIKRNIAVTSAALESAILANSTSAAPAGLARAAATMAFTKGTTASASTLMLIKSTLKFILWGQIKTALIASTVFLAVAGVSTVAVANFTNQVPKSAHASSFNLAEFRKTPAGAVALDACQYIKSLKLKGELPGVVSNTPVGIEIPWLEYKSPNGTPKVTVTNVNYPLALTMTVHANEVDLRYRYTLARASASGPWELQKSWIETNAPAIEPTKPTVQP